MWFWTSWHLRRDYSDRWRITVLHLSHEQRIWRITHLCHRRDRKEMLSSLLQVDPLRNSFHFICVYMLPYRAVRCWCRPWSFFSLCWCRAVTVTLAIPQTLRKNHQEWHADASFQGKGRRRHLGSGFSKLHEDLQRNHKQKLVNGANGRLTPAVTVPVRLSDVL